MTIAEGETRAVTLELVPWPLDALPQVVDAGR
jgi:hypothetical protein